MIRIWALGLCLSLSLIAPTADAKLFRNAYISFELPTNWDCELEGTEWVCYSKFNQAAKEAIIILTAKEVGPTDTFAAYMEHLKAPRTIDNKGGGSSQSKVLHVRQRRMSDWDWIDGLHLGSEIGSYYTRYLATIKDRISILITFSAHKQFYTKYSNDFLKAISSLKVVASKDLLTAKGGGGAPGAGKETIGAPIGSHLPSDIVSEQFPDEDSSGSGDLLNKLIGLALIVGAIGFYLYRRKNPKAKKKK